MTSIERVAAWLGDLQAAAEPAQARCRRGRARAGRSTCATAPPATAIRTRTATCSRATDLGKVTPNADLRADPGRLNSYTEAFRQRQLDELFAGTKYQFKDFKQDRRLRQHAARWAVAARTLSAQWLGADLARTACAPAGGRPKAFVRGSDVIDGKNGGFVSPPCDPDKPPPKRHLLRHGRSRQRQWRPRLRHCAVGRREGRPARLSVDLLGEGACPNPITRWRPGPARSG